MMIRSLVVLLLSGCAAPAVRTPEPLIDVNSIDGIHLIPGPPALGSKESKADFATLRHLQKIRTKAECDRASEEVETDHLLRFFRAPRGPLTAAEVERLNPLFDRILVEGRPAWSKVKNHFARPRPYVTDPGLHPCVTLENTFAYPSGHSSGGRLFADLLIDLFPERATALRARGDQIGDDRLIGGVHHPSDVRDARVLADAVFEALKKNPNFVHEFSALKAKSP